MKEVSVSSVLSVWLKRAMGLAPWNSRMLGTATVPNLVERLVEDGDRQDTSMTNEDSDLYIHLSCWSGLIYKIIDLNKKSS